MKMRICKRGPIFFGITCILHLLLVIDLTTGQSDSTTGNNSTTNSGGTGGNKGKNDLVIALIPKSINNPYFQLAQEGCEALSKKKKQRFTCLFVGPEAEDPSGQAQVRIIEDLIAQQSVTGIAVAVNNEDALTPAINRAVDAGMYVVTFDSDAPRSRRSAYVGTDNTAFGNELGKLLLQLEPHGGTYGIISTASPNMKLREEGVRKALADSEWVEVRQSPTDMKGNATLAMEQIRFLKNTNPAINAIIPCMGAPMRDPGWMNFVENNRDVILIVGDALPNQIELLNRGYGHGLVGQLPYSMGETIMELMYTRSIDGASSRSLPQGTYYGTNLLEVLRIPLNLPPVNMNMNYIGHLRIVGYIMFSIVALLSIAFGAWTFKYRKVRVVRASQPMFLIMICAGTLFMGSAIIPLGIDDEETSQKGTNIACMITPWLISIGFIISFSALFSKTWRINKIFHNPNRFQRIKVTPKDVMIPFIVLMTANLIVLICWTILAPLEFERSYHEGTDGWNRNISSYGACVSNTGRKGGVTPYLVAITVINFSVLLFANIQAYQARDIRTEFSESRYIAIAMACLIQAAFIGIPLLFLLWENPRPDYVVRISIIFSICMAILLVMFIPKIIFKKRSEKKRAEKKALREQQNGESMSSRASNVDDGSGGLRVDVSSRNVCFQEQTTRCDSCEEQRAEDG